MVNIFPIRFLDISETTPARNVSRPDMATPKTTRQTANATDKLYIRIQIYSHIRIHVPSHSSQYMSAIHVVLSFRRRACSCVPELLSRCVTLFAWKNAAGTFFRRRCACQSAIFEMVRYIGFAFPLIVILCSVCFVSGVSQCNCLLHF